MQEFQARNDFFKGVFADEFFAAFQMNTAEGREAVVHRHERHVADRKIVEEDVSGNAVQTGAFAVGAHVLGFELGFVLLRIERNVTPGIRALAFAVLAPSHAVVVGKESGIQSGKTRAALRARTFRGVNLVAGFRTAFLSRGDAFGGQGRLRAEENSQGTGAFFNGRPDKTPHFFFIAGFDRRCADGPADGVILVAVEGREFVRPDPFVVDVKVGDAGFNGVFGEFGVNPLAGLHDGRREGDRSIPQVFHNLCRRFFDGTVRDGNAAAGAMLYAEF